MKNVFDTKFKVLDDLVFDSRYSLFHREEISDELVLHEYALNDGYTGMRLVPEYNKNIRGLKYDYETNYEELSYDDDSLIDNFRQIIVFNPSKRRIEIVCCYEISFYNNSGYDEPPHAPYETITVMGYKGSKEFVVDYLNRMWNKGKDIKDYHGVGEINFTEEGKKVILYDVKRYEELSEKIKKEQEMSGIF